MIRVLLTAFAFCHFGALSVNADDPEKVEGGPIEIDFSSLDGIKVDYSMRVTITAYGGKNTSPNLKVGSGARPDQIAKAVRGALPDVVDAKVDGGKVVIKSLDGKPIAQVQFTLLGVPNDTKDPTVRRLPK
jgi:hypothetical protein